MSAGRLCLIVVLLSALTAPVMASPDQGDFRCNCGANPDNNGKPDFHRETPEEIIRDCTPAACNTTRVWITLDPQGPTFKGDSNLGSLYQFVFAGSMGSSFGGGVMGLGAVPARVRCTTIGTAILDAHGPGYGTQIPHDPADTWAGLSAHIINAHLKPFNIDYMVRDPWLLVMSSDSPHDAQACLNVFPGDEGRATILIQERAILGRSPAGLASALGHELVHTLQYKRSYSLPDEELEQIEKAIDDVDELEARSWQKGVYFPGSTVWDAGFAAKGPALYKEQTLKERNEIELAMDCNEWLVAKHIVDIRTQDGQILTRGKWKIFKDWMNENPWVQKGWVPMHPEWEKMEDPGPAPPNTNNCS